MIGPSCPEPVNPEAGQSARRSGPTHAASVTACDSLESAKLMRQTLQRLRGIRGPPMWLAAVDGTGRRRYDRLCLVGLPTGSVRILDSLAVPRDQFDGSPDF